jgi:hypothetical protein
MFSEAKDEPIADLGEGSFLLLLGRYLLVQHAADL